MTEYWWNVALNQALHSSERKKKRDNQGGGLTVISEGDVSAKIPENIANLLGKGPKKGVDPNIPAHELWR